MKKLFLPAFFLVCMTYAHAQNKAIDSLQKVLQTAKEDTSKVKILNGLSENAGRRGNYDTALYYARNALQLAEKLNFKKGATIAYRNIGRCYGSQGNYPEALKNYFASLKISEETGDKEEVAYCYLNIGSLYRSQGNDPEALKNYFASLQISEEIGDKEGVVHCYLSIGNLYQSQGNYPQALKNYFAALKIYKETGDKNGIAYSYNSIGIVYDDQGNYPEALKNHFAALKIYEETGDKWGIASSYNNIGNVYYADQGNYPEALKNYFVALEISEEIGNKHEIVIYCINIGNSYVQLNRAKEAKEWLQKALIMSNETGSKELIRDSYNRLAAANIALGNYKGAYENYKMYVIYKDSLYNEENTKKLTQTEMQFEFDKKESLAKAEQEKKDIRQKNIRNSISAGLAGTLIFLVVVYRQRNRISREKKISDFEKKRSDELLLNILPSEVAEELKETGSAAAKHFDNVTVLFTDFVNFTLLAEKLSPQQLVDELHHCFKAFDEMISKHNIEKIKTIGDAYLAVAGLPLANPDHAENIVNAAIEIRDFMLERRKQTGVETFEIRVGVHSGSVVAGIVGVKKFAYDIWGDTVNTAARMEQSSEAGKINISETTYDLVKDQFECSYRGEIEAKNKGAMKMYFVETA